MIYLQNTTAPQVVDIPVMRVENNAILTLIGTVTLTEVFKKSCENDGIYTDYFVATIALPEDINSGEYEYKLTASNGDVIGEGLAVIGNYAPDVQENNNTITYKQYE